MTQPHQKRLSIDWPKTPATPDPTADDEADHLPQSHEVQEEEDADWVDRFMFGDDA